MKRGGNKLVRKKAYNPREHLELLDEEEIVVERPAPFVSKIIVQNALFSFATKAQILNQLFINDQDPDVRVTIIDSAGEDFCVGQDIEKSRGALPFFTEGVSDGQLARTEVELVFKIFDLAKPVIACVRGACFGAGGMELAAACDILITADDAKIGYPDGRNMGLPDLQIYPWLCGMRNALAIMLQAETMSGIEAVNRGFATRSYSSEELEEKTLAMATRIAKIPADLLAYNKRSVHRAFESQGMRANLRHAVDLESLMFHSASGNILTRAASLASAKAKAKNKQQQRQPRSTPSESQNKKNNMKDTGATSKAQATQPRKENAARVPVPVPTPHPQQQQKRSNGLRVNPTMKKQQAASLPEPSQMQMQMQMQAPRKMDSNDNQSGLENVKSQLEDAGVHLHLHKAINIHVHSDGKGRSKL